MKKSYEQMTDIELIHDFCSRVPELYMDMMALAQGVRDRNGLIRTLRAMDIDRDEGRHGPLLGPPPRPKS